MALTADAAPFDFGFDEAEGRLADFYAPCLTLVLQLRAAHEYGDADVLRGRCGERCARSWRTLCLLICQLRNSYVSAAEGITMGA